MGSKTATLEFNRLMGSAGPSWLSTLLIRGASRIERKLRTDLGATWDWRHGAWAVTPEKFDYAAGLLEREGYTVKIEVADHEWPDRDNCLPLVE